MSAHRTRNQETGVEVENCVEECADDGGEDQVGSDGHHHHPVVRERYQTRALKVEVPQELRCCPLEVQHCIRDACVHRSLNQHIGNLY